MTQLTPSSDFPSSRLAVPFLTPVLHALAFASGLAALVYEVVWTRRLTFVFGASIRAVSAVLAAYMAGLALGSHIAGRRIGRPREPLRTYAALEAGIGLAGLAVPVALGHLRVVDTWFYDERLAHGWLTAYRFALTFLVVGLPASLMGATFPILARATVGEHAGVGSRVATLYGANTAGAVVGTFLSGFYLIGRIGVVGTERVAVAANFAVAIIAVGIWRADRGSASTEARTSVAEVPSVVRRVDALLAATFIVGAGSIACEVLWSRAFSFTFSWLNSTTYAFPAMLGMFLAGVALGSVIVARFVERTADATRLYGVLVALSGVFVALSATVMRSGGSALFGRAVDDAGNLLFARAVLNIVAESAAVVGVPAMIFGASFPVAVRAMTASPAGAGPVVSRLYAASTGGAIAGSVLAAFVIVPLAGITHGVVAVGAVLAATGLLVVARAPSSHRGFTTRLAVVTLGAVACVQWRLPTHPLLTSDAARAVFYEEGPTATVAVVRAPDGFLRLDVDAVPVAGTSPTMLTDQKSLAHVPMMLAAHPRRALTVGFGSGGTSHSYLLHTGLDRVDAVEIAPEVLHAAPYLTASNHGVLVRGDPRYRVIIDDARSYLAHTRQTYDIIATDCTDLRYRSNANLYDLEYFQFCRARLAPEGIVAVWMPLGGLSRAMFSVALRTFGEVFPDFVVFWPNGYPSHYVVLIGWRDGRHLRWDRLVERLSPQTIRNDLAEISLSDPVKLLSTFLADGRGLRDVLRDAPINSEDHPVLEYRSPLSGNAPGAVTANLEFLLDHRVPAALLLEDAMPAEAAARLARMEVALPHVVAAHAASFRGDTVRAARRYLEALAIAPEDDAVRARLADLRLELEALSDDPWAALYLCRTEQLTGDRARARECFDAIHRPADEEFVDVASRWRAALEATP